MNYTQTKDIINEVGRERLEKLLDEYGEEIIEAAIGCDISPENIEERYCGQFNSDGDFAMDFYDGVYGLSKLDELFPGLHVDWEGTARDLMMDYYEDNGYYFRVL